MPDFTEPIRAALADANIAPADEVAIVDEIAQHLEEEFDQAVSRGASEQEATAAALATLAKSEALIAQLRRTARNKRSRSGALGLWTKGRRFAGFWDDIRFGLRMLAKQPGFAFIAIMTLGLGIGASTAMFSLVQEVLVRPLPYAHPDRLFAISASSDSLGQTHIENSGPDFIDYVEQNRSFAHIAAYIPRFTFTWTGDGEPKLVVCTAPTEQFYEMLGVRPYLGRLYQPREYTYLENDSLVVSYRFWKNQLGGDPGVIGRRVHFEGETQTIMGVLPPMPDLFPDTDVWAKLTTRPSWPYMQWRGNKFLRVIGELKAGVTPAMAEEELTAILRRDPEEPRDVRVHLVSLKEDLVGSVRLPLFAALGAAGIILVVACINIAALLLARGVKREGEIAVRLSLGAGLPRIAQQLVTEALLLSVAGSVVGLFLAWGVIRLVPHVHNLPVPRVDDIHLDALALLFAVLIAMTATLFFGWIPALGLSRAHLFSVLRPRGVEGSGRRGRSLSWLIVAELACSVVLSVSVGLLVHSFWRVMHTDPGFNAQSLLRIYLRTNYYSEKGRPFWRNVLTETASLAGVRSTALSDWRPGRDAAITTFLFDDRPNDNNHLPTGEGAWVSADFFRTVEAKMIKGRGFNEHDDQDAPAVAVINAEAARQFWPGQDAIGKRIAINYTGPGRRTGAAPRWREVIGIVGNMRHGPLDTPPAPAIYLPYLQDETGHDMATMSLFVRTDGNPMFLANELRDRIHAVDPDQPVQAIQNVADMVSDSVATRRYTLALVGSFGAVGLLLAAVGVYGVISYATSQRRREFGIRIALGATRGNVISNVLHRSAVLTAAGALVGTGCALLLTRSFSSLLYEVNPLDLLSFCGAVAMLALVSLGASLFPAWRASRVDPIVAMQSE